MNIINKSICCLFFVALVVGGCASTNTVGLKRQGDDTAEVQSALESVAESLSGSDLDDEDLRKLSQDIQHDADVKSAVSEVTEALSGQSGVVKYCPVTGKRYSSRFTQCPIHHVPLEILEE